LVLGIFLREVAVPVLIEKDGPVTIVTLSRPQVRNAVDRATARELAEAFQTFDADDDARVAVLAGDQGHFCAGADLKKIAAGRTGGRPVYRRSRTPREI
jgi:enoyl-CoA hydratase